MNRIRLIPYFFFVFFPLFLLSQNKIKLWQEPSTRQEKHSELSVFLPEKDSKISGISVIICPGGSYYWLDMDNEGYKVAKRLNKEGITAFVLKYRTAQKSNHHPAMIQDLQRAIVIVKSELAQKYGLDTSKVGVMGFSAGGHLAGLAATYFDFDFLKGQNIKPNNISFKPYFAAMIYPVVSMEDSICHKKSRENLLYPNHSDIKCQQQMSLEQNVRVDMSPIFLLHCVGDKTVDYRNSLCFDKTLSEKNVKHQFILLDKCNHSFGIKPKGDAENWINEFLQWLNTL